MSPSTEMWDVRIVGSMDILVSSLQQREALRRLLEISQKLETMDKVTLNTTIGPSTFIVK